MNSCSRFSTQRATRATLSFRRSRGKAENDSRRSLTVFNSGHLGCSTQRLDRRKPLSTSGSERRRHRDRPGIHRRNSSSDRRTGRRAERRTAGRHLAATRLQRLWKSTGLSQSNQLDGVFRRHFGHELLRRGRGCQFGCDRQDYASVERRRPMAASARLGKHTDHQRWPWAETTTRPKAMPFGSSQEPLRGFAKRSSARSIRHSHDYGRTAIAFQRLRHQRYCRLSPKAKKAQYCKNNDD